MDHVRDHVGGDVSGDTERGSQAMTNKATSRDNQSNPDAAVAVTMSGRDWRRIVTLVVLAAMANVGMLLTWVWHADRRLGLLEERVLAQQVGMTSLADEVRDLIKDEIRPMRDDLQRLIGRLGVMVGPVDGRGGMGGAVGKP